MRAVMLVWVLAISLAGSLAGFPARAEIGRETNLPLPRFVSLKADEGNVRRGPSFTHRIDWVFKLRDMPLRVIAEYEHWRRVEDRDGAGGWVHYTLLSGVRTVLIEEDMTSLRSGPDFSAPAVARLELGVVARLGSCKKDWCLLRVQGHRGWAPKSAIWGVLPEEIRP